MRRLSDVDLRLLRIFSTIVDCNGFRNAQIALNMAQSTLSTHLSTLEARLGSRLCERGRGGFRLTLEGEETYRAAQELFRSIEGFGARMRRVHGREEARLRLGVIDTVASFAALALPRAIAAFSASHPQVFIDFRSHAAGTAAAGRRRGPEGRRDRTGLPGGSVLELPGARDRRASAATAVACIRGSSGTTRRSRLPISMTSGSPCAPTSISTTRTSSAACARARASQAWRRRKYSYSPGLSRASCRSTSRNRTSRMCEMRAVRPREWSLRSRFTAAYAPDTGARELKAEFIECLLSAIQTRSQLTL